tara:strand:- start:285 stop:629 length:345 start_codon:yes stop_codon:yes gene_type:complete
MHDYLIKLLTKTHYIAYHGDSQQPIREVQVMEFIVEGDIEIKDSPWGMITLATRKDQGIWLVSTDTHGGIWLSPERREELPEELKGTAFLNRYHGDEWWEEDCDAQRIAEIYGY